MIKLRKNPNYLILAALSSLTIFTWIGLEVYNLLSKPTEINIPKDHLVPVKTSFDQKTIELLNQRLSINDQDLDQIESRLKSPVITQEPNSATSSPSAQPIPQSETDTTTSSNPIPAIAED